MPHHLLRRLRRAAPWSVALGLAVTSAAFAPSARAVGETERSGSPNTQDPATAGKAEVPATRGTAGASSEIIPADDLATMLELAQGYGEAELTTIENGDPVIVGEISGVAYQLFFLNCADDHTGCAIMNFYAIWDVQDVAISAINEFNRMQPFNKAYLTADNLPVVELNLSTVGGMTRGQLDAAFERWTIALAEFPRQVLGEGR